jgi:inner membrane protein
MDPITHGILGASFAGLREVKRLPLRRAMLIGAVAGMSPDLDVLIRSADYPLLALKYHRHFTHAIPFSPIWGLMVAGFLWVIINWRRKDTPFLPVYLISVLAIIAHGILDAMTNYGTHLFWPFTHQRESWSIISIIDPLFTLPLLGLALYAARRNTRKLLPFSVAYMLLYWGIGIYQQQRVTEAMYHVAAARGHRVERFEVKPAFGNLLAWRSQYRSRKQIYIDGYHHSFWAGLRHYEGGKVEWISPFDRRFHSLSPTQQQDLQDFAFFSDYWLTPVESSGDTLTIADARFGILPNSLRPMWAVELNPATKNNHAGFINLRQPVTSAHWQKLWQMVSGTSCCGKKIIIR